MDNYDRNATAIGVLMLTIIGIGILSISPEVDSAEFLTAAAANAMKVTLSAVYQFVIALIYLSVAVLFYSIVKGFGPKRALGYLCLTAIAAALIIVGTVILSVILLLSQEYSRSPAQGATIFGSIGYVFKAARDFINHGYMVLALCAGKILLYSLLFESRLIPKALSVVGIVASIASMAASLLILFRIIDVVTAEYLLLNLPTALQEIFLGIWLLVRGLAAPIPGQGEGN